MIESQQTPSAKFRPTPAVVQLAVLVTILCAMCLLSRDSIAADTVLQNRIAAMKQALSPSDAIGHQSLARFMYHHHLYRQALVQVNIALKINPKFQDAQLLKSLIEAKVAALPNAGGTATTRSGKPKLHKLLTMDDIYKIRLWELSKNEKGPLQGNIVGGSRTLKKFWDRVILPDPDYQNPPLSQRTRARFIAPTNFPEQVRMMLLLGSAKYWNKIHIDSEPVVLRTFRSTIQPVVLQSCATVGCHRGQDAHGFKLFGAIGSPTLRQTYTNFYILSKASYHGHEMINRSNPQFSLLYQYLLPRDDSAFPHPGKTGPRYRKVQKSQIIAWIESLRFPARSYGISDFQTPVIKKTVPSKK